MWIIGTVIPHSSNIFLGQGLEGLQQKQHGKKIFKTVHTSPTSAIEKSDHLTGVKPACVLKYNKMMRAVYKADIMKGFVKCARKTIK